MTQQQHIPLDLGAPITQCSLSDPYVVLMSDNGDVMLLTLKKTDHGERLNITKPQMSQVGITQCSLSDPYVVLMSDEKRLNITKPQMSQVGFSLSDVCVVFPPPLTEEKGT